MLNTKYGSQGGDASINDSAPSTTTTYSGTKVEADNATQDAAIAVVDSELEYDADDDNVFVPAGLAAASSGAYRSVAVIPDGTAGSLTASNAENSVLVGFGTEPGSLANNAVVVGSRAGSSSAQLSFGVAIGYDAARGAEALSATVIGSGAAETTGTVSESVVIGREAGPVGSASAANCVVIGSWVSNLLDDYPATGNLAFTDFDIIIGAVGGEGLGQPLIHANNDSGAAHWSPGLDADLGTTTQRWGDAFFSSGSSLQIGTASISESGASGMYDYCEVFAAADSSSYADASSQLLSLSSTNTAPSLGHMTISNAGGYTTIQNTSGETRRWLINTNVWIYAPIGGSTLMVTQNWIMISPTRGAATSTNYYAHCYSNADGIGDAFKGACSEIVEIAADDYVHICGYGDTTDGTSWLMFGGSWKTANSSSVTITELPM